MPTNLYSFPNIHLVSSFDELVSKPFQGEQNIIGWLRDAQGDFSELVQQFKMKEDTMNIEPEQLEQLNLSAAGQMARQLVLDDYNRLKACGASPALNLIKHYSRDEENIVFPRDVYSFHVDQSPIPTSTYLCTYHGPPSEVLPNTEAEKKVMLPEWRLQLKKLHEGPDETFESFLREQFYDLHYQASPNAHPIRLGTGNLWRLAVEHPGCPVLPCIHRAPPDVPGLPRLLLIC